MSSETVRQFPSSPTRVLISKLPTMVAELIRDAVAKQPDIQLVGEENDPAELLANTDGLVDVIVLGVDDLSELPGICSHLFAEYPNLKIMLVPRTGNAIGIYWLGLHQHHFTNVNSRQLLRIIRLLRAFEI